MSFLRMIGASLLLGALLLVCEPQVRLADAREFRAADIQEDHYPTVQALRLHRPAGEPTDARPAQYPRVSFPPAWRREPDHRPDPRRRHRHQPHQRRDDRQTSCRCSTCWRCRSCSDPSSISTRLSTAAIGDDILAAVEPHGFIGLTFYDFGIRSIYTARRQVRSIEDLRGQRIRIQQSDLMEKTFKALGAAPIELPYGQVATALTANLVDGAENNWPSYVSAGHYKVAPFYTATQHSMAPEIVIMSRRAWDELSPEDRDDLSRRRARVDALHAPTMVELRAASAQAGPASRGDGHRIDRPQASSRRRPRLCATPCAPTRGCGT